MALFYDARDASYADKRRDLRLYWLDDLGALPFAESEPGDAGFVFAGMRPIDDYRRLVADRPLIRDRPEERAPLMRLDTILAVLDAASSTVDRPRTWAIGANQPLPEGLVYPLFLRTATTLWKLGGKISKVGSARELIDEAECLRRAFGWDEPIMAREWCELAPAGRFAFGPVAQEVRTWAIDGWPVAWSFHALHVLREPRGFPLSTSDTDELGRLSREVARAFASRLVVADFARRVEGGWVFIEAGPGSAAGTAHEGIFKAVAQRLDGLDVPIPEDRVGGALHAGA